LKLYGNTRRPKNAAKTKGRKAEKLKSRGLFGIGIVASCFIVTGLTVMAIGTGLLALWTLYPQAPPVPIHTPPPTHTDNPNPTHTPNDNELPGTVDWGDEFRDSPAIPGDTPRKPYFYSFLILGMDDGDLHDTIMVAGFDTVNNKLGVVSIPRDSQRDVTHRWKKINAAYQLGLSHPIGGPGNAMFAISKLIGFWPDFYIIVDLDVLGELVDIVAPRGIEFNVPIRMHYTDPSVNPPLRIFFEPGVQMITGDQAMLLMRFRQNNRYHITGFTVPTGGFPDADLGRIRLQQDFMRAVARHTLSVRGILNTGRIIRTISDNLRISPELDSHNLLFFVQQLLELNVEDITFASLGGDHARYSGTGGSYIWLYDDHRNLDIINNLINPFLQPVLSENLEMGRYGFRTPS
jgi:LCP family protein required for cell wall assembly